MLYKKEDLSSSIRSFSKPLFTLYFVSVVFGCASPAPTPSAEITDLKRPSRLLVLLIDQLRPEYIERFNLFHFKRFAQKAITFPDAYVGHLPANAAISHTVLASGLLPKHLPWQDRVFWDKKGLLGSKKVFYLTTQLKPEQQLRLLEKTSQTHLLKAVRTHLQGPIFTIALRSFVASTLAGSYADSIITLGAKRKEPPLRGWREPSGLNLPPVIKEPFGGRFFLDCSSPLNSHYTLSPLDGNRFVPGSEPNHVGGDRWVADAVLEVMKDKSNWRAILASFGSTQKIGRMLAEQEKPTDQWWAKDQMVDLKNTLLRADFELGRILDHLTKTGLLSETLIVITAGHGGQANTSFHGIKRANRGKYNATFGRGTGFRFLAPPLTLAPVIQTKMVRVSLHDAALRFWLRKTDAVNVTRFAAAAQELPGTAEIYTKKRTRKGLYYYIRTFRTPLLSETQLKWAEQHHQSLLDSMASHNSPEVVVLLLDNHGYGYLGDEGGAQEKVQRIPLWMKARNLKKGVVSDKPVRLVDVNAMIRLVMGLPVPEELDGKTFPIEAHLIQ